MKCLFFIVSFLITVLVKAQYWQQKTDYDIEVVLNEKEHTLKGFEKVSYTNNAPDTLYFIWFHLWPNAFKNDKTAYTEQAVENGSAAFYFAEKNEKGYINGLQFTIDGIVAKTEAHPQHQDIIKLVLPLPLLPGQTIQITTPFFVKLLFAFSRSGHHNQSFQITQWYPKPAVYDSGGWHPIPYLDQGEFYSEFGDYNVRVTVPKHFVVAASGSLQNEEEKAWLLNKAALKINSLTITIKKQVATTKGFKKVSHINADTATKTLQFVLKNAHDFAFVANPNFIVNYDTCKLTSGKIIEVFTYYTPEEKQWWHKSILYSKDAVQFYSNTVGEYPYPVVSVVQGPESIGGGMEYPTLAIISPQHSDEMLDGVIAHEIGHNWFYGILATNEREAPWMDEGFNSFYEHKYTKGKYNKQHQLEQALLQTAVHQKTDQPIVTPAAAFSSTNYALIAYYKTAKWLQLIENAIGPEKFAQVMKAYYDQWKFKHPSPHNFKQIAAAALGEKTDSLFSLLYRTGNVKSEAKKGWKVASPFAPSTLQTIFNDKAKNSLFIMPLPGYNKYDKLMACLLLTNYNLPPVPFQFVVMPFYSFNSNKLNSLSTFSYSIFPDKRWQQIKAGFSTLNFSKNSSLDVVGNRVFEHFYRITPSVRFTFKENIREHRERFIEWKTYFIGEKNFSHFSQNTNDDLLYVDSFSKRRYYVNQLGFSNFNYRIVYPYHYTFSLQQGKSFYRLQFNGNYFFNYNEKEGLNIRLFAAKFGELNNQNRMSILRYQPKLSGVTGEEDYTYSNYFLGRTATYANSGQAITNKGLAAQQIMIRDVAFKLRLDRFPYLQGRSDNWVAALNFNSTLPQQIIPTAIPLKLFLDIGTYADAWNGRNRDSRIIWVGGIQLSFLKQAVNLYAPLLYSKQIKENMASLPDQNSFFKRLTFSVDIHQLNLRHPSIGKFFL